MQHIPVLLNEILSFFENQEIQAFIDGTLGAGGHAFAILTAHPEIKRFYGFDRDQTALNIASITLKDFKKKVHLIHANYRDADEHLEEKVDGILLDLGVSSMQLEDAEKGFSFYKEGPLDMRMDTSQELTAATVVNTFSEKKLEEIIRVYGEERKSKRVAKAIVESRKKKKFETTFDLVEALKTVLTWGGRKGKIHPMTLVFQGLRIYVNDELRGLEEALPKMANLLNVGGKMGVISFHSLEDRIVKHTLKGLQGLKILTKKPLVAASDEIRKNPRSRSAKLRFVEKVNE